MDTELMSAEAVAELLGVNLATIYRWRLADALPAPDRKRPLAWRRETIEAWQRDRGDLIRLDDVESAQDQGDDEWTPSIDPATGVVTSLSRPSGRSLTPGVRELKAEIAALRTALSAARIRIKGKTRPDGTCLAQYQPGQVVVVTGFDGFFLSQQGYADIMPWDQMVEGRENDGSGRKN